MQQQWIKKQQLGGRGLVGQMQKSSLIMGEVIEVGADGNTLERRIPGHLCLAFEEYIEDGEAKEEESKVLHPSLAE